MRSEAALLALVFLIGCAEPPSKRVDTVTSNDGTWILEIEPPVADCALNEPCSFTVLVERMDGRPLPPRLTLSADAAMPDHRHGLNAQPVTTRIADGRFRVEGLLLHMPGYWEVYLDLTSGVVTERAQVALER